MVAFHIIDMAVLAEQVDDEVVDDEVVDIPSANEESHATVIVMLV